MLDEVAGINDLKSTFNPVIIWGTKIAAKISYHLLQNIGVSVVAVGDNNRQIVGTTFFGIPVLALSEIEIRYPNAIIIIGTFYRSVADSVIKQLKSSKNQFTVCRFEKIEYIYEMIYLKRNILNKAKLFKIINNVSYEKDNAWKIKANESVMLEYRYVVTGCDKDLKVKLSKIYGIKNLILIIGSDKIKESLKLIEEMQKYNNIGHIIAVIDYKNIRIESSLKYLSEKVFYIICDESAPEKVIDELEEVGFAVDKKKIPDELFDNMRGKTRDIVSEKSIVESLTEYAGKNKSIINYENLSSNQVYIVQLFNGLANQMLIYLFGRFLERESGRPVIFDDTILGLDIVDEEENVNRICRWNRNLTRAEVEKGVMLTREKNSFYKFRRAEVAEVFDVPIHLLSDYFDEETWSGYLNKIKKEHTYKYRESYPLCQVLIENGYDMTIIRDTVMPDEILAVDNSCLVDTYTWGSPYMKKSVTDFMLKQYNAYFTGIWATGKADDWFFHNRKWVNKIFNLKLKLNKINKKYVKDIKESDSVIVHIRRGDFVCFKLIPNVLFYRKSIELIETITTYKNKKYFIFSDDIEWCCKHKRELGIDVVEDRVEFVYGNEGIYSSIDLYLMSLGKVIIPTPGSSFSYMAILMSNTIEKCICIPKYFYEVMNDMNVEPMLMVVT